MDREANLIRRCVKIKHTLVEAGWRPSKKADSGLIMCGWITNEFITLSLMDFCECCQTETFDNDSEYVLRRIWKLHCARNPEICGAVGPEQELINREFDCEKMDKSQIARNIKDSAHYPFRTTAIPSGFKYSEGVFRSVHEARAREDCDEMHRKIHGEYMAEMQKAYRKMEHGARTKKVEGLEISIHKTHTLIEPKKPYKEDEEDEDEGAKIAKRNLISKSIESISKVFEDKFGIKTKA